jgi:NhaP-type Na+/H+ or K+/H+ antiporter
MHDSAILVLALVVFGFGLLSRRLGRGVITPPLAFLGFGMLLAEPTLELLGIPSPFGHGQHLEPVVHLLGELTLVVVLFTDAAQIDIRALCRGAGLPARLLGIGMPLTVALGAAAAAPLFSGLGPWELALLGAILAPTDAALGQAVVTSKEVPLSIRQGLSAESGLNDGIAVPLVMIFASLAGVGQMVEGEVQTLEHCLTFAAKQVLLGPLAGLVVGGGAAWAMSLAIRRQAMGHAYQEIAGLAIALIAYTGAGAIGGNGFIAAFVAGLVLGNSSRDVCDCLWDFAEAESQLLMLVTFFLVGLGFAWPVLASAPLSAWIYAVASLTVLRMLPVAIALLGSQTDPSTRLYLGWFGPRGLASILFAILLLEELHVPHSELIVQIVLLTVLLSVVAHGMTAAPMTRLFVRSHRVLPEAALDHHPIRKRALQEGHLPQES